MTREGKLSLIAGFSLVVLVGILLSDHLSRAAHVAPEPLVAVDRAHDTLSDQTRIEFGPGATAATHPSLPEQTPSEWTTVDVQAIRRAEAERRESGVRYTIRRGDTLTAICRRELGSTDLVDAVASLNGLDPGGTLSIGQVLLLPGRSNAPGASAQATPPSPLDAGSGDRSSRSTYRVRAGDTLSELAQKLMGSARHTDRLHAMNKGVIPDPDNLKVGAVIIFAPPATN